MIKKFWHVGLTVRNLEKAVVRYKKLGYRVTDRFEEDSPKLKAVLMSNDTGNEVELFEFIDKNHPQVKFIKSHIALISDSIDEDVDQMIKEGYRVVIPKTEASSLHYAFLEDPDKNYIELAEFK